MFISVSIDTDSSIFAFSDASSNLCNAIGSLSSTPTSFLKLRNDMLYYLIIYITTTHMRITISRFNFHNFISNFKNRYIKSTTSKIKNYDLFIFLFIKTICKRSCCWFVYNSFNFKSCYLTSVLCCFSLIFIKICRNSYYSFCDFFS